MKSEPLPPSPQNDVDARPGFGAWHTIRAAVGVALLVFGLTLAAASLQAAHSVVSATAPATVPRQRVGTVELRGELRIPPGRTELGTPFGGLSGISYDAEHDVYYAISDDRGNRAPARFYQLTIDLAGGRLVEGAVKVTKVITLTDANGQTFSPGQIDPEGIALARLGNVYVSSEGDAGASPPVAPFVNEFGPDGRQVRALPVPAHFWPQAGKKLGIRNNAAFEPLTLSPDGETLFTATEDALAQDGPDAGFGESSPSRMIAWDTTDGRALYEHVYPVSPIPGEPVSPTISAGNGLVELIKLEDGGTMLAMERSFVASRGVTVRLFETRFEKATDVSSLPALIDPSTGGALAYTAMIKREVADIGALGIVPDNLEGMTLGPTLADGRRLLVLVSDDNFSTTQVTQFVALAVTIEDEAPGPGIYLPFAARSAPVGPSSR